MIARRLAALCAYLPVAVSCFPRQAIIAQAGIYAVLLVAAPALAATFNCGFTSADGAFNPRTTVPPGATAVGNTCAIPLRLAGTFDFTTINIPGGVTVKFTRNAANTPVTLLASGHVAIGDTIIPDGMPLVLRGKPQTGVATSAIRPGLSGGTASGKVALDLTPPNVISAEATRAAGTIDLPVQGARAAGSDDPVTHVRVLAFGGRSHLTYLTSSGREIKP